MHVRNKTKISIQIESNLIKKRTMFKQATNNFYRVNLNVVQFSKNMSTWRAVKFTGKAKKELSNDNKRSHTHVNKEVCQNDDCTKKKCPNLCEPLKEVTLGGHNTHGVVGRLQRDISETDALGKKASQYYVPRNDKKKLSPEDYEKYEKDIKPNSKQQEFIEKHIDKYHD
jgi:hypothetical protein